MNYRPGFDIWSNTRQSLIRIARFKGRAPRREMLAFNLVTSQIVWFGLGMLLILALALIGSLTGWMPVNTFKALTGSLLPFLFLPIFVRRLHDQDRSGWWSIVLAPPVLLSAWKAQTLAEWQDRFGTASSQPRPEDPWPATVLYLICFAVFLVLVAWPGTIGPNRFGPDPRLEEDEETAAA